VAPAVIVVLTPAKNLNRRLFPLFKDFGKKSLPLHRRRFKSLFFYFIALIFFPLTQAKIFVSASFLPKVSEVERLKVKFWSSEIGRGQYNYRRCHRRHSVL
jgi:hypothetical protein